MYLRFALCLFPLGYVLGIPAVYPTHSPLRLPLNTADQSSSSSSRLVKRWPDFIVDNIIHTALEESAAKAWCTRYGFALEGVPQMLNTIRSITESLRIERSWIVTKLMEETASTIIWPSRTVLPEAREMVLEWWTLHQEERKVELKLEQEKIAKAQNELKIGGEIQVEGKINPKSTEILKQGEQLVEDAGEQGINAAVVNSIKTGSNHFEKFRTTSLDKTLQLGSRAVKWISKGQNIGIVAISMMVAAVGVYEWKRYHAKNDKEKLEEIVRTHIIDGLKSPAMMMKEQCEGIHQLAEKVEGLAQDSLSVKGLKQALEAFQPIHHQAYEQATLDQMKNISTTAVENWGDSAILPQILYTAPHWNQSVVSAIQNQKLEDHDQWHFDEFLRPLQLQHALEIGYDNSIHLAALKTIINSTALPYPADSEQFTVAYVISFLRMAMPHHCHDQVHETPITKAQFHTPRQLQAQRKMMLKIVSQKYFAARSNLSITEPLPAVKQLPYLL